MEPRDTLSVLVAELIPSDELPGAAEAGTAAQVRAALATRPALAAVVEAGLLALDRSAARLAGQSFAALPALERQQLMAMLARGSPLPGWTAADPPPEVFWNTVRGLALAQFYGSPAGQQVTGFPGPVVDRGGYRHTIVEPEPRRGG